MEYRCSVLGCLKSYSDGVKLHKFPFDNKSLMPIWIMATNRSDWVPDFKSRICNGHFSIDDYELGDKSNELKPNACPMMITSSNTPNDDNKTTFSDTSWSGIDSDSQDLPNSDSQNSCDKKLSGNESLTGTSSDSNSNDVTGLDDDFLSSLTESSENSIDNSLEATYYPDEAWSLSSLSSIEDTGRIINSECAVVFCNENARNQVDRLFFIKFPSDNVPLCESWWKICGHNDKFDPLSNDEFKICSIHFKTEDFTTVNVRRDGQLYRQTSLKNDTVPTLYLQPNEFLKFIKKRKKTVKEANKTDKQDDSIEIKNCVVPGCKKTSISDGKSTLFFKFPLENLKVLEKWINSIKKQPLYHSDCICSDHFENYHILKLNYGYALKECAVPSIEPKNPFVMNPEDNGKFQKSLKKRTKFVLSALNDDCLLVKEKKRKITRNFESNMDGKECNILSSFEIGSKISGEVSTTAISQINSTKINNKEKNVMIPKSKNNGNDRDYIYLDTLVCDNVEDYLSFEKKSVPKNSRRKVVNLLEKKSINEIAESIMSNKYLTQHYGEMLPPYCDPTCQLNCYYSVPGPQRREIFEEFHHMVHNVIDQNCYIAQFVKLKTVKKNDSTFEHRPSYYLSIRHLPINVCRTFFINTLGISENRLDAILDPINYSWFSDRDTLLKAIEPKQEQIEEPIIITDFMKSSLDYLKKIENLCEIESDSEVSLENVPVEEYEKVLSCLKGTPRVLSSIPFLDKPQKQYFDTSICAEFIYKNYSENYIRNKTKPPFTNRQFKKIYNHYMKSYL